MIINSNYTNSIDMKVSVCMITYNHEAFIAKAIEGVLMQQTDFPVELIIGEDCSTDGTREIARRYAESYPDKIRLLLTEHNQGMMPNFVNSLNACQGNYVALCEGDDYWTDPLKLQKQVDFMETHPDYSLCFHSFYTLFQSTGEILVEKQRRPRRSYYDLEDVINSRTAISTATVLFRKKIMQELPDWFIKSPVGDTTLFVLLAQQGKIGFIEQPMAVYRVHKKGKWQGADDVMRARMRLDLLALLRTNLGQKYEKLFNIPFSALYVNEARVLADRGDKRNAKIYLKKSILSSFSIRGKWIDQVVMVVRLYFPRLYFFINWFKRRGKDPSSSVT